MTSDAGPRPGVDGPVEDFLVRSRRFFTRSEVSDDLRPLPLVLSGWTTR